MILFDVLLSSLALGAGADPSVAAPELRIPAWSAFARPEARALRRDGEQRVVAFDGALVFYAHLSSVGELALEVECAGEHPVDGPPFTGVFAHQAGAESTPVTFARGEGGSLAASVHVAEPGYHRVELQRRPGESGPLAAPLVALTLRGEAADGARASTVERRNASSVHLGYPLPKDVQEAGAEWFHCSVTPRTDPLWSYYMTTGWHRGYFGMQVNSPTERRVIFSVWDSGAEPVDRDKVAAEDRVQLVRKGEGVVAKDFGNEGTGGHSHLVVEWQLGDTFDFLVRAEPEGTFTTYTGWFRRAPGSPSRGDGDDEREEDWRLVASFRAPKDGSHLRGLYSFSENFWGANGDRRRVCEFGRQWTRTSTGEWHELTEARFTHDGHGRPSDDHSGRLDRSAGVRGARFYLAHGGFVDDSTDGAVIRSGDPVVRMAFGSPPETAER